MVIGILALQGAVEPHETKFKSLGVFSRQIKQSKDLEGLDGLVLPGGESSAMIHLLKLHGLWFSLKDFVKTKPTWGLCAGAILLAREVGTPLQESLEAIDISINRNAFGRQSESFIAPLIARTEFLDKDPFPGVFIRAPRIMKTGKDVQILFEWNQEPVMVREGFTLASTFHPELTESDILHRYFLKVCEESC